MYLRKVTGPKDPFLLVLQNTETLGHEISIESSLPFDFKTLWTLDEGSEKDNNMFKHSSIPKEVVGIFL